MKTKAGYLKRSTKLTNFQLDQLRKQREKTHYQNQKSKNIITDFMEIKRIVKEYSEQLCANKLDNLDEIDKLLQKHKLIKLIQEEIDILNAPITKRLNQ